ncbi:hypothetical protein HB795_03830 [Listeria welshimeri]|nr:hypothetical protein [Listeria welshimeri]MBC2298634.1 hypothetical protein [Listeria welshimeri]
MDLTHEKICFAIDGYINDICPWLEKVTSIFSSKGYPLKSVSYDINYERFERKSLKLFMERLPQQNNIDKLFSFTVYYADNQNLPATWHYGVHYDMATREVCFFFDKSYRENKILDFFHYAISQLLIDVKVDGGYLFYEDISYIGGRHTTQNLYRENGQKWWEVKNPRNRDIYFNLGNRYRHIYLQNILSGDHYNDTIERLPLSEWISKYSYGTLQKISEKNWLWTIPREELYDIGIVFYNKGVLLGVD